MKYKQAKNEYVRIRKEELRNYKRYVIENYTDETELFRRYVNNKVRNREGISKLRVDGKEYEDAAAMPEFMNDCFQAVLTRESNFNGQE